MEEKAIVVNILSEYSGTNDGNCFLLLLLLYFFKFN